MGKCYTIDRGAGSPVFSTSLLDGIILDDHDLLAMDYADKFVAIPATKLITVGRRRIAEETSLPFDLILIRDIQDEGIIITERIPNEVIELVGRGEMELFGLLENFSKISGDHLELMESTSCYSNAMSMNRVGSFLFAAWKQEGFSIVRYRSVDLVFAVESYTWVDGILSKAEVIDHPESRLAPMGL